MCMQTVDRQILKTNDGKNLNIEHENLDLT